MRKQGCCLWMELTSSAAGSPSQVAVTDGIEDHGAIPPPKRAGESGDSVGRAGTSGGASVGDTLNEVSTGTLNTDGEGQYINRNEVLADLSLWKAQYDEKEEERNGKLRSFLEENTTAVERAKELRRARWDAVVNSKAHSRGSAADIGERGEVKISISQKLRVPRYTQWTQTGRNLRAQEVNWLQYMPYLGDDEDLGKDIDHLRSEDFIDETYVKPPVTEHDFIKWMCLTATTKYGINNTTLRIVHEYLYNNFGMCCGKEWLMDLCEEHLEHDLPKDATWESTRFNDVYGNLGHWYCKRCHIYNW